MNLSLLLIEENLTEAKEIISIIGNDYKEIEIIHKQSVENIHVVSEISPDIILFDIDSDSVHISENIEIISLLQEQRQLPLIVTSKIRDYNKIFTSGAINFIPKPIDFTVLISNLRSAIHVVNMLKSIQLKEKEIEEKNERIEFQIQNELKQREIIIKKNKEIMADIRYASRIQQAILPNLEFINKSTKEYFILHQPKSHVSGDFYWLANSGSQKIITVGDCTGHGLSGALMHMLGSVYLNEIVTKGNFKTASDILNQLRDHIMHSLNQTGESGEAQDGLDIALCVIDCDQKKLQFSGANNPLYIIRNKELIEIKGDRMPVGIHINFDKPFTNHLVDIESDDILYMFSDGFADQFGGPKGKKFRYKQFKELLISISNEPMSIQKEILNNTHDKWRGSLDQIDDILVFGIKIK
ncbi:MAG: SpoIIE family protein phosphatase [Bacteroidetes bacterium]|nr:SpoIIE family protein phosphatase [Bacteroidota bacterium]